MCHEVPPLHLQERGVAEVRHAGRGCGLLLSDSSDLVWRVLRKVHHVRKQLLALSAQLIGIEKEVAMLMERGIKVRRRSGHMGSGHMGSGHMVVLCAAAGTAASEGSSSGVQRDEVSGLPEPEHSGGDDAGVSLPRHPPLPPRHGYASILCVIRLLVGGE